MTTHLENYPVYLDSNATTPIESQVRDRIIHYLDAEYGNAASRTHMWGQKAKKAVQEARAQIASVVSAKTDEVLFTSGATESNNIAILGLKALGNESGRKHIISTQIEHKAVLEPLEELAKDGFKITLLQPNQDGWVEPNAVRDALREDTLLVSVMQVNNETGVVQPIAEIARMLDGHEAFLHVDAAQGFGKGISALQDERIDLISISAHKIFGPKGVGALVSRRRKFKRIPLAPLMFGGGQERGLRPGTLPVHLIAGFGEAAQMAMEDFESRGKVCAQVKAEALKAFESLDYVINGSSEKMMSHVLNISFPGIDSEAAIVALKDQVAISNGSACTSQSYSPSHVLQSMGMSDALIQSSLRISWCHLTGKVDWAMVAETLKSLQD